MPHAPVMPRSKASQRINFQQPVLPELILNLARLASGRGLVIIN
jgi:hypothetical protein